MKVEAIRNIEYRDNIFYCNATSGICISEIVFHLEKEAMFIDSDHCECLHSFVTVSDHKALVRIVSDKNDIDEFMIFTFMHAGKTFNLKLRFKR